MENRTPISDLAEAVATKMTELCPFVEFGIILSFEPLDLEP